MDEVASARQLEAGERQGAVVASAGREAAAALAVERLGDAEGPRAEAVARQEAAEEAGLEAPRK